MNDHKSTQYLMAQIERKDRRFRLAQGIFMLLVGLGILAVLLVQSQAIDQFRAQSAERARGLKDLSQQNKTLLEENKSLNQQTNRYIQCISQFFATTDRANRVLTDLDKCSITQNGKIVNGVDLQPTGSSVPASAATSDPAPAGSSNTNQSNTPAPTPPAPAAAQPVRVLGIPVCIPLTQVCARQ